MGRTCIHRYTDFSQYVMTTHTVGSTTDKYFTILAYCLLTPYCQRDSILRMYQLQVSCADEGGPQMIVDVPSEVKHLMAK